MIFPEGFEINQIFPAVKINLNFIMKRAVHGKRCPAKRAFLPFVPFTRFYKNPEVHGRQSYVFAMDCTFLEIGCCSTPAPEVHRLCRVGVGGAYLSAGVGSAHVSPLAFFAGRAPQLWQM